MNREPIGKGDKVRIRPAKLALYAQIYKVTKDDLFDVAHVERRVGGKRVLYLAPKDRETWIPTYPSSLLLVQRKKPETQP